MIVVFMYSLLYSPPTTTTVAESFVSVLRLSGKQAMMQDIDRSLTSYP